MIIYSSTIVLILVSFHIRSTDVYAHPSEEVIKVISLAQVNHQFQFLKDDILQAVARVIDRGQFILGTEVSSFEEEVCHYLKSKHAVSVANGTDALILALRALDIGYGDEVITTPLTFFATAEAISSVGATPVFVDIDPYTYNLDPHKIEEKITNKTRAILPVHLYGQMCDVPFINEIAKAHRLFVIEDACQAFGAAWKGKKSGTIGDIGCFSFFPTKNLSTIGDGGLIVTQSEDIARRVKQLRHHGTKVKNYHDEIGYNSRLDEIHAAILRVCLPYIDEWTNKRVAHAHRYSVLEGTNNIRTPYVTSEESHCFHLYCIEHPHRDHIHTHLKTQEIASGVYYPLPLHLQKVYQHLGYTQGDFPVCEEKILRLLALPMHPYLSIEDQKRVIETLKSYDPI